MKDLQHSRNAPGAGTASGRRGLPAAGETRPAELLFRHILTDRCL